MVWLVTIKSWALLLTWTDKSYRIPCPWPTHTTMPVPWTKLYYEICLTVKSKQQVHLIHYRVSQSEKNNKVCFFAFGFALLLTRFINQSLAQKCNMSFCHLLFKFYWAVVLVINLYTKQPVTHPWRSMVSLLSKFSGKWTENKMIIIYSGKKGNPNAS